MEAAPKKHKKRTEKLWLQSGAAEWNGSKRHTQIAVRACSPFLQNPRAHSEVSTSSEGEENGSRSAVLTPRGSAARFARRILQTGFMKQRGSAEQAQRLQLNSKP